MSLEALLEAAKYLDNIESGKIIQIIIVSLIPLPSILSLELLCNELIGNRDER